MQEVQGLISWFVGVGQMEEGCRLSKTVFGGGKMCGKRRDKRMFRFYDSMFAVEQNAAGKSRMMCGCERWWTLAVENS